MGKIDFVKKKSNQDFILIFDLKQREGGPKGRPSKSSLFFFCHVGYFLFNFWTKYFYCNSFDEWVGRGGGVLGRWGVGVGGMRGACEGLRGACVGRVWGAISVGIARSALLSGYLGKSGHLPRYLVRYFNAARF